MLPSRLGCTLSLKTPNMGNVGLGSSPRAYEEFDDLPSRKAFSEMVELLKELGTE